MIQIGNATSERGSGKDMNETRKTGVENDSAIDEAALFVLPQTELEFPIACVSITPSEGGFHGHSPERIELTGA